MKIKELWELWHILSLAPKENTTNQKFIGNVYGPEIIAP